MVGELRRRAFHAVHQRARLVRADMRLHPELTLVALIGLVHFRVTFAPPLLGRGERGDDRRVHARAFAQQQPFLLQRLADLLEDAPRHSRL